MLNICDRMKPEGVIVQFGGQTPLNLAKALEAAGVPIIGTSVESIDMAEDRERFRLVIERLGLKQPPNGIGDCDLQQALRGSPSGSATRCWSGPASSWAAGPWRSSTTSRAWTATWPRPSRPAPSNPILIDKFLEDAIEVDVDAVCDGTRTIVGGVMQHIEEAGIHSGDSACAIPPFSLPAEIVAEIKEQTYALAEALNVRGLMNIQFAVKDGEVYVLEVNPRASRTVPFVSKATGLNLAQAAARVMVGKTLDEQGITDEPVPEVRLGQGERSSRSPSSPAWTSSSAPRCGRPAR